MWGLTSPPRPSGRAEPCTLRILTDAFTGAHGERERKGGWRFFFVVFVKASPQDEHGVERPALSQGCGGGVPPRHPIIPSSLLSHHPFYRSYLFHPFKIPFFP